MLPPKLKEGDEIRIIASSKSLSIIAKEHRELAQQRLEALGLKVTFGKHVEETDEFESSTIQSRIEDLHEAFADKNVKAILQVIGGHNANQLLAYIDYDLIKENPKFFFGYSDTTALQNAIYAKTGLVTYSSPSFSAFGMEQGFEETLVSFKQVAFTNEPIIVTPSKQWSNDKWYVDQKDRTFIPNEGYWIINKGTAEGTIVGANLCTLNLLQGTEYMPKLEGSLLFIEDDYASKDLNFDRDIQSLIHQPGFDQVKGLVIGRFEKLSEMTKEKLTKIIKTKKELEHMPIIANVDFGHTKPMITFPIGGKAKLEVKEEVKLEIVEH